MAKSLKNAWKKNISSPIVVVFLLVFFFPIGLFLLWKYSKWGNRTKTVITTIGTLIFLLFCVGIYNSPPTVAIDNIKTDDTIKTDSDTYPIEGHVSTFHSVRLVINNKSVYIDSTGDYTYAVPLHEGDNTITVTATSEKGSDSETFMVHRTTKAEFAERKRIADEKKAAEAKKAAEEAAALVQKQDTAQQTTPSGDLYKVVSIVDGDTIKVSINGKTETIRLIGIDTPETQDPRKPVQCYGKEATSRMQHYVQSKSVRLAADSSQGDKDKYNRLLRYIFLEDGQNVGYQMILDGVAHEYTYNKPYQYQKQFKAAETMAQQNKAGFWAANTCNGITNQSNASSNSSSSQQTTTPQPQATQSAPSAATNSSVYYANCTAARNAGAAPIYSGQPGYRSELDRDNDGIACE